MKAVTFPLALVATALTLGAATLPAQAAPAGGNATQVVVRYADLDLSTDSGAAALYQRIVAAARAACPDAYNARDARLGQAIRACREQAVAQAVQAVGSPKVAALSAARTSRARAS